MLTQTNIALIAYGFAAVLAVPCVVYVFTRLSHVVARAAFWHQRRSIIIALLIAAGFATIEAQKRGSTGTGDPPAPVQQTGTGVSPVEDIADTFHFSAIDVSTNGTVTLTAAWTNGFLTAGQTIDILVKADLRDATWTWLTNGVVAAGTTNMSWTIENQSPSNSFYKTATDCRTSTNSHMAETRG